MRLDLIEEDAHKKWQPDSPHPRFGANRLGAQRLPELQQRAVEAGSYASLTTARLRLNWNVASRPPERSCLEAFEDLIRR